MWRRERRSGTASRWLDGWMIDLSGGTRHDFLTRRLSRILERAAEDAGAHAHVRAPMDIATPACARKPDVAVISAAAASDARWLGRSLHHGADVLLAVEVVSRGSGSERADRMRKVTEYTLAGVPQYWIVDFDPEPRVQVLLLSGGHQRDGPPPGVRAEDPLTLTEPFPVTFDLAVLRDFA
jgi:hypothetical protein